MKEWRERLEQIEKWRKSPHTLDLNLGGSSFASAAKILKRLQETMKPLLEDLIIFDVSELPETENPLLSELQRDYLRAFQSKG